MGIKTGDILNIIILSLLKGLSRLPFFILYGLADVLAVILHYGIGYRRKVIEENLRRSFPEKEDREIRRMVKAFYRHFCDISLETAKAWSMTREDFEKRLIIRGTDEMNRLCREGKSVILLAMHYNNWEWTAYTQTKLEHKYLVVYNPVRGNPRFEQYLLQMREKWGAQTIPVHKSVRTIMDFNKMNIPVCLGLVGDQRPPYITKFWTTFLNQEACFNLGPEKIAQRTNQPVFFCLPKKIKRGYYEISFVPLIENPASMSQEDIMLTYVRTMEKYIREAPEYYLWSHKRWKQQRPEDYLLYG
jgi:Kdo2-lipid IVA lauroyltransferase/acyltransferase